MRECRATDQYETKGSRDLPVRPGRIAIPPRRRCRLREAVAFVERSVVLVGMLDTIEEMRVYRCCDGGGMEVGMDVGGLVRR